MSSAIPMDGCVSFSWMVHFWSNSVSGLPMAWCRRTMSCKEQLVKKNCCISRRRLPSMVSSGGYSTLLMVSDSILSLTAPM